MTIAGLARAGDVGLETIRFYQRRGLLDVPVPAPGGGSRGSIRRYGDADAQRLQFVRSAKAAGFSLDEIAELLQLDGEKDRTAVRLLARKRIAQLDVVLAELSASRAWLEHDCAAGADGPCPILSALKEAAPPPPSSAR